jgi:PAS domain S-box-containing protein
VSGIKFMVDETEGRLRGDTEAELRRAEQQISAILTIAADAIISLDDRMRITLFNEGAETIFGYSQGEIVGQGLDVLIPQRFRTPHHKHVSEFAASPTAARKMGERQEIFAVRKDGTEFPAEASIAKREIGGKQIYMVVLRDVTERKLTQDLLSRMNSELETRVVERTKELETEIRRREEAHAALIQAQRMEAFGQLTGGVAHDFNNLLTIIMGNLELLGDKIENATSRAHLKRAADAAEMGAGLTSRLLTFARRRRLSPQVLNLNELVLGLTELLNRSLGEPITLTTMLAGGLWPTRADPSEVENAILNLAINARDAMPHGGTLIIETGNISLNEPARDPDRELRAGDYVRIAVSDTGVGMSLETLERAFEPFFTTKEPGRGTGLGLSTVYGFAEQSGGHASISSEVGKGTTVNLYLPRVHDEAAPAPSERTEEIPLSQNSEVVLVVEDNPEVRELTLQRIEGLGYVVLEAENGPAAVRILESGEAIDLIFSDIVMAGGMSGYELARWARAHVPKTKVLLTTGFAAEEARADQSGATGIEILRKPYNRAELALALRDAIQS